MARSGLVDLIISHHAHVVEPIQKIGSTWVVYGLGNLLSGQSAPSSTQEELLVRFSFARSASGRFVATRAEYEPLLMANGPLRVLDIRQALQTGRYGSSTRTRLQAALTRTIRVVQSLGGAGDGLRLASVGGSASTPG